jgi:hypothetical protein
MGARRQYFVPSALSYLAQAVSSLSYSVSAPPDTFLRIRARPTQFALLEPPYRASPGSVQTSPSRTFRGSPPLQRVRTYADPLYSDWPYRNPQSNMGAPPLRPEGCVVVSYCRAEPFHLYTGATSNTAETLARPLGLDWLGSAISELLQKLTDAFRSWFKRLSPTRLNYHLCRCLSFEPWVGTWLRRKAAVPRAVAKWCMRQAILTALGFWNSSFHKTTLSTSDAAKQIVYGCERVGSLVGAPNP